MILPCSHTGDECHQVEGESGDQYAAHYPVLDKLLQGTGLDLDEPVPVVYQNAK